MALWTQGTYKDAITNLAIYIRNPLVKVTKKKKLWEIVCAPFHHKTPEQLPFSTRIIPFPDFLNCLQKTGVVYNNNKTHICVGVLLHTKAG